MRLRLWLLDETEYARKYSRTNPADKARQIDGIWIPKSVCERTTKFDAVEHEVRVAKWWANKNNL